MHNYLRSVGFSKVTKRKELRKILHDVMEHYDEKVAVENHEEGVFIEYIKYYGADCGISVCGQYDEDGDFHIEYFYPFFHGTGITTKEKTTIERHSDKESYAGACDDLRIGITLIFYLQYPSEYMIENNQGTFYRKNHSLTLSGLAREGKILFPVMKDKEAVRVEQEASRVRTQMIEAARDGDEEAMENLTMEDMDTYTIISQRLATEDVLSIVDTYFMPYGIECDQYNVLGEIIDLSETHNPVTGEEILRMTLDSNDLRYDVCINRADLLGEPQIGRRFKGLIWLQGQVH